MLSRYVFASSDQRQGAETVLKRPRLSTLGAATLGSDGEFSWSTTPTRIALASSDLIVKACPTMPPRWSGKRIVAAQTERLGSTSTAACTERVPRAAVAIVGSVWLCSRSRGGASVSADRVGVRTIRGEWTASRMSAVRLWTGPRSLLRPGRVICPAGWDPGRPPATPFSGRSCCFAAPCCLGCTECSDGGTQRRAVRGLHLHVPWVPFRSPFSTRLSSRTHRSGITAPSPGWPCITR